MQVLFVTVDPERDTPEVLRQYVPSFNPAFLGLYGTPEETARAAKEFKVYHQKQPVPGGGYSVDHSAGTYILDTEGRLRLFAQYGAGRAGAAARHPPAARAVGERLKRAVKRKGPHKTRGPSVQPRRRERRAPAPRRVGGSGFLCSCQAWRRPPGHRAFHLGQRLALDLADALGRDAELVGEIVQRRRVLFAQPARLDDAAAARVETSRAPVRARRCGAAPSAPARSARPARLRRPRDRRSAR